MSLKDMSHKGPIRGTAKPKSVLIAVGGGKGGVGKSFVSSNIGIFLANMGFKTTLVDLDLGAPNLHTYLGEEHPHKNFHEYISGKAKNLQDVAVSTQFANLQLISGANDHSELANLNMVEQSLLCRALYNHETDFTILDLSAGTHNSTLDFFMMATRQVIILTPDPTSIENAYRFMKASYFRRVKRFEAQLGITDTVREIMAHQKEHKVRFPTDLIRVLKQKDPAKGLELEQFILQSHFNIVLNQTRSSRDESLGHSIKSVSKKYFGIPTDFLGALQYDNAAWHSLRKKRPLLLDAPNTALYSQMLGISRDLASPHMKKAVV